MKAAVLAIAAALMLCLSSPARADQPLTIAVAVKPGVGQALCAEKFREMIQARTRGKLQVGISYQDSGGSETQILQRLQAGQVQMAVVSPGPADQLAPAVRALEYPFMFRDYAQADKALSGSPGQTVLKSLEKAGFKGLAFGENGFRHLTNNLRPVRRAQDLKGLRIRVMESALQRKVWEMLGAVPQPHSWPAGDLLARGEIDGQENPLQIIWAYRLDQQQKHLSLTAHGYAATLCLANLSWFNALSPWERKSVQETWLAAAGYQRQQSRRLEAESLKELKKAGMQVVERPDRESLAKKVAALDKDGLFAGADMQSLLKQFRRAAR